MSKEEVQGYITLEEQLAREKEAAARRQAAEKAEQDRLAQELLIKIELAKTTVAPPDCMIEENMGGSVIKSFPAHYLGDNITYGDYNQRYGHGYAIDGQGKIYKNHSGVGGRREFVIGRGLRSGLNGVGLLLGEELQIAPNPSWLLRWMMGPEALRSPHADLFAVVNELPGWQVIEENQPNSQG